MYVGSWVQGLPADAAAWCMAGCRDDEVSTRAALTASLKRTLAGMGLQAVQNTTIDGLFSLDCALRCAARRAACCPGRRCFHLPASLCHPCYHHEVA